MIVTIDGPAGSGKSTAARGLAKRLGFRFLDTGAMYRTIGWAVLRAGLNPEDEPRVAELARDADITLESGRILYDGEDVTERIRTEEVTHAASVVAMNSAVREAMAQLQRRAAQGEDIVTEGRDQGTHVFPQAECKFFLTANAETRARRRREDMRAAGSEISARAMQEQLRERDERDTRRAVAPLAPASDAVVLDTSDMSVERMLDVLEDAVRTRQIKSGC